MSSPCGILSSSKRRMPSLNVEPIRPFSTSPISASQSLVKCFSPFIPLQISFKSSSVTGVYNGIPRCRCFSYTSDMIPAGGRRENLVIGFDGVDDVEGC